MRYIAHAAEDCEKLNKRKVDYVFAPAVEICPQGLEGQTYVDVPDTLPCWKAPAVRVIPASRPSSSKPVQLFSRMYRLLWRGKVSATGADRKMVADEL